MRKILAFICCMFLIGCTYPISEVDVSKAEKSCVRECTKSYSECVQAAPSIGTPDSILKACRESFRVCVDTCPPKN